MKLLREQILIISRLLQMETHPSRKFSLVLNFAGTLGQLLMFTYSCDDLIRQSFDVGNAIFAGPWANLPMDKIGSNVRKNLIFIIIRSNKFCFLTAGGFFPVSLETCTSVIIILPLYTRNNTVLTICRV